MNKNKVLKAIFLLPLALALLGGCAKKNIVSAVDPVEAKEAAVKYEKVRATLEQKFKEQNSHQAIEEVQDFAKYRHLPKVDSKHLRTQDYIAEWVVYPYEDRYGMKYDMYSVHAVIHQAEWITDHGAVTDYLDSNKKYVNKHKPYYYKQQSVSGSGDNGNSSN